MANENTEIGDIVKKCKILLLDIEGTTTSISFVKDKLFPYAEENVKEFLDTQWEEDEVKEAVAALRKLALEDQEKNVEGVVAIPGEDATKEEQIEGLVKNVKWQMSLDRKVGPLKTLQGLIWKQGYSKGDIKGHVYDDVLPALEQWRSVEGRKIYIYSSGSVQAQKLLFSMSSSGDMLPLIDGHFDVAIGAKQEEASYKAITEKIECKPEEILFLTDIVKEAQAARGAGACAALVSREGNAPLPPDAGFPVLHSFAQLTATNKRKPDAQDEQPAKVPKTEVEADVKTVTEATADKTPEAVEKTSEPEKMEVEDTKPVDVKENKSDDTVEAPTQMETVIEEVAPKDDVSDTSVAETKPLAEEAGEKPVDKEVEKMETETIEKEEAKSSEDKPNEVKEKIDDKNDEKTAPVAEETPPTVITEIEEITDKKETLSEVSEIIEDIEPVVEEPAAAEDIEDLKNVGEVLEKECDEILSKVQDVTNLDNIPVKPLLNPIAEEAMETENTDSNDIVERILDTEMELAMKPSEDIPGKTEVAEIKPDTEEKSEEAEPKAEIKDDKPTDNITEEKQEETKKTDTVCSIDKADDKIVEKEEAKSESVVESKTSLDEKKPDAEDSKTAPEETTMDTDVKVEESKVTTDESKTVEKSEAEGSTEAKKEDAEGTESVRKETPAESTTEKDAQETKEVNTEEVKTDSEATDAQINGKTTNGDSATANLNGDASKEEELSSRLSVENGKEAVNGSNGDSVEEQGQGDNKVETGASDIKVKSVATDESRSDPIEQPTEA